MYRPRPQPEITEAGRQDRRPWSITGSQDPNIGRTNLKDAEMLVPLGDDPISLAIRCHELLHVKHSPQVRLRAEPGISPELFTNCYLAAEDGRIEVEAAWAGSPMQAVLDAHCLELCQNGHDPAQADPLAEPIDPRNLAKIHAMLALAAANRPRALAHCLEEIAGTPLEAPVKAALALIAGTPISRKKNAPRTKPAPSANTRAAALLVAQACTDPPEQTPPPAGGSEPPPPGSETPDPNGTPAPGGPQAAPRTPPPPPLVIPELPGHQHAPTLAPQVAHPYRLRRDTSKPAPVGATDPEQDNIPGMGPGGSPWARLLVYEHPRPKTAWRMGVRPPNLGSDEGVAVTRPERFAVDGRVYGRRRSLAATGAVRSVALLVDASGSMEWGSGNIMAVLEEAPAALVATYSSPNQDATDWGLIQVWAQGGTVADLTQDIHPQRTPPGPNGRGLGAGCNRVDGPALAWLADRPEKVKVWYSDTLITDTTGGLNPRLWAETINFCNAHGIRIAVPQTYGGNSDTRHPESKRRLRSALLDASYDPRPTDHPELNNARIREAARDF